ncbi:MAG: endonuclease/exonuclease/phosphatase family protein [Candidatus Oceanisphaera merdipullorum]|nr:endonuclease/exonuclease/phosphatase family protein [Candidatus Oceanisphaera merdipullorum]
MELTIFWLATAVTSVVTLLPLWQNPAWWVRGLDFPRLQFISVIGVLSLLALWRLDFDHVASWSLLLLNLSYLAYHLWWILPYTPLYPKEVKNDTQPPAHRTLTLLNANVLATNHHADSLLSLVKQHQPDILVTLESNLWWQEQLSSLAADYPYQIQCPLENLYGMHVYSRLPLTDKKICYLVEDDVPSMHCLITLKSGDQVRAHFLHPAPPSPTENDESAPRDAELLAVGKRVAECELPVIVAGDLNDVAWSPTTRLFRKISGLLDPRIGRGMFNTFNAQHIFIRWPLDHLFHSHHFRLVGIKRLSLKGSDHFSLFTSLSLHLQQDNGRAQLHANDADKNLAEQKMAQENVSKKEVPVPK